MDSRISDGADHRYRMVLVAICVWGGSVILLTVLLIVQTRRRPHNLADTYRNGTELDTWTPIDKWEKLMEESSKASKERRVNGSAKKQS